MPDLLEQDLTEEEQRRLEEEQALVEMQQLLASRIAPPDSQLPQEAIPAENVGFTNGADGQIQIDTPEGFAPTFDRQMVGDAQYQNELARAQRGNGFLNADAGPAGNTIVAGYDPAVAEAGQNREREKLAVQAERFMGAQGYQSCIKNGGTPAECSALWGPKMWKGAPADYVNFVTRREPLPKVVAHKPQWGKPTAQVTDRIRSLDEDEKAQQAMLTRGTVTGSTWSEPLSDEQKAGLKANIDSIRKEKQQILSAPENNSRVDLTGIDMDRWNNPPARPTVQSAAAPAKTAEKEAPFKEGATVRNKQNGKLYRIVKGVPVEVKE